MARRLDQILIVDVESTCWDEPPPHCEESEIIEIGLSVVDVVSMGLDHEVGLDGAYQRIGMPMEGTHHRGDDDAWNIAAILCRLLVGSRTTLT